jgi:hypothetical protein
VTVYWYLPDFTMDLQDDVNPAKVGGQGDQIGRIFAIWAIFFFGQILGNY